MNLTKLQKFQRLFTGAALATLVSLVFPVFVLAATFSSLVTSIQELANQLVPLLISLALVVFFWGIIRYIASVDENKRKEGKNFIVFGVIALAVIVSIWGIVKFLQVEIGLEDTGNMPPIPQL